VDHLLLTGGLPTVAADAGSASGELLQQFVAQALRLVAQPIMAVRVS
jgi:hypothetical protein